MRPRGGCESSGTTLDGVVVADLYHVGMTRLIQMLVAGLVSAGALSGLSAGRNDDRQDSRPVTQPATRPGTRPEGADAALDRLLEPAERASMPRTTQAVQPAPAGEPNNATGRGAAAVAPDTPRQPLISEGTYVIDRSVRVRQSVDGRGLEVTFVADGRGTQSAVDPPMLLAPNLQLQAVEAMFGDDPDRPMCVTGRVTEYRGRNYLLLEKVVVR